MQTHNECAMPVQTDTTIQFSNLKPGNYDFDYTLGKEFFERFEYEDLDNGDVHFDVHLERKERLMLFNISFSGTVQTQCDRCLGAMEVPVSGKHLLTVQISNKSGNDNEDVVVLPDKECQIDLAQWFYEYVVIALPMRHVHPDDENGNPTCDPEMLRLLDQHRISETTSSDNADTQPDVIDPRWAQLMKLKDN